MCVSGRTKILGTHNCFFNDTATTEIYTLSLHDALPISVDMHAHHLQVGATVRASAAARPKSSSCGGRRSSRSEEHTPELQSRQYLVCRLPPGKKTNTCLLRLSHLLLPSNSVSSVSPRSS